MVKVLVSLSALLASALAGSVTTLPDSVAKLMDTTADPCVDFFQYACGGWYKDAVIPDDRTSIDTSFSKLAIQNEAILKKVLEANKPKLAEFYSSCMDTATLSALGTTPLKEPLAAIRSANSTSALADVAATLSKNGISAFATVGVSSDDLDATKNALFGVQNRLPLAQSYYTDPKKWATIEADYKTYINTVLTLAGYSAQAAAAAVPVIIKFEQRLAGVQLTKLELMESEASPYTPLSFFEANEKYPLTVGSLLKAYGFNVRDGCLGPLNRILFYDLSYFDKAEALLKSLSVDDLRTVVEYKLIHGSAPHLTPEFRTANWKLFGAKLSGQKVEPTRSSFCTSQADAVVGEILGKYYLEQVWSSTTAKRADEMVQALEASFKVGIDTSDWLDNSTRVNAKTKLSKFVHLLGGPENPQLYPTLSFDPKDYIGNRRKVSQVDIETNMKLLGTTVDKKTWGMTAQTVNAYYDPSVNEIVFPAAILQAPFFDSAFDPAQNFGAIGMVIGHEITHGFDNMGRNYDGDGNIRPWWSDATNAAFNKKAQCIVDQYSKFEVKSEVTGNVLGNINGRLTLGETIADNGGLKTSYRAYKEYLKSFDSQYTTETGEKLFYLSFAQGWCSKNTDARLQKLLLDSHPPGRFRIYGAVQNNAEFARVFKCPANTFMNPTNKCLLWE